MGNTTAHRPIASVGHYAAGWKDWLFVAVGTIFAPLGTAPRKTHLLRLNGISFLPLLISLRHGGTWLTEPDRREAVRLALDLVPFAGIAFLWFMGVLRDRLGEHEDKFFATVFLGSGLLFVAILFGAAAVSGALIEAVAAVISVHPTAKPTTSAAAQSTRS